MCHHCAKTKVRDSKMYWVLSSLHLHVQQALNILVQLQSLAPVQAVVPRRTPLLFAVKQPGVVRELEANISLAETVPRRTR
jgi:hypothetical protein